MSQTTFTTEQTCPRAEIAAYIDGELSTQDESLFEQHLAGCEVCAERLNEQKRLLCALDFAFDEEKSFELPKDFAKTVAVRAESDVSGLRNKNERIRALILTVLLFLAGVAVGAVGKKTGLLPALASSLIAQAIAVGNFFANLFYDFGVGGFVILRAFSRYFVAENSFAILVIALLVGSFAALSLLIKKYNRA